MPAQRCTSCGRAAGVVLLEQLKVELGQLAGATVLAALRLELRFLALRCAGRCARCARREAAPDWVKCTWCQLVVHEVTDTCPQCSRKLPPRVPAPRRRAAA